MRLSEAIRLGSLAIQKPLAGDVRFCAIGMACEAIGKRDLYLDEENYKALFAAWPWIYNEGSWPKYHRIHEMFDDEVCSGKMTIEQLADQVRAWEDELEAKGISVEQVTANENVSTVVGTGAAEVRQDGELLVVDGLQGR